MSAYSPADEHGIHAVVGDRMVVGGPTVGKPGRDGEVTALHHEDGTPLYDVRWSDTGRTTVFFPGPDAHVRAPAPRTRSTGPSESSGPLTVTVTDNGIGLPESGRRSGLRNPAERAERLNGRKEVAARGDGEGGTRLEWQVAPLAPPTR